MVGKFDNRSSYMRGLFSDGVDRLGGQAKTILIGHLQETGRFGVVDRDNLDEIAREARIKGQQQALKGADFAITGDVVEFGRKEVGDRQLFGILGPQSQPEGQRPPLHRERPGPALRSLPSAVQHAGVGRRFRASPDPPPFPPGGAH
jgi:Curli production assembly/transport component CsgG